jgi:hypothetical protein
VNEDKIEKAAEKLRALLPKVGTAMRDPPALGDSAIAVAQQKVNTRTAVCAIIDATVERLKSVPLPDLRNLKAEEHAERAKTQLHEAVGRAAAMYVPHAVLRPADLLEREVERIKVCIDVAVGCIVQAAVEEHNRRLRIALRQVAEHEHRTDRERTLLHDLVEALGGEAAG